MQELQTEKLQPIELPRLPDNPLVSVLVANYNYARYIGEALESVLCQTYPSFEVIVCDDGSNDNSCEVIEAYAQRDTRLKLIRKQNGGVASALNAAYRESSGQILSILDADDVWMPNKLQRVVEAFKSEPKGGFVIHNVFQIDGYGKLIKPTAMLKRLASGWMAPSALENSGCVDYIPPASALCVRREVANLIFPMNEAFVRNADSLIFRLAPFVTVIVPVSEVLSKFRLHGANLTSFTYFTVDVLERGLNTAEQVYQEQKKFLRRVYGAEVAENLASLKSSLVYHHDQYLLARLKGASKSERREAHQQLVAHPQFHFTLTFDPMTWLLRWGEYLPNAIFAVVFHQVSRESRLKRMARLVQRVALGLLPKHRA